MATFVINGLKFDCGLLNCSKAPKFCKECIVNKLEKMGFEISTDLEVVSVDEKVIQMERDKIWQKFLDVLNIKHIILMDKESGLALLNYPVSAVNIEVELLSGFIQANIAFSETSKGLSSDLSSSIENPFYELQYQKFNILLKNGEHIRVVMILDHKVSNHLKMLVSKFLKEFEIQFKEVLLNYQQTGAFSSKNMAELIINSFNINLVFPMTLAHAIPPEILEDINKNQIQKAIINLAKDILSNRPFFYIISLLDKVKKIVNLEAKIILYEFYILLEQKIINPTPIETVASNLDLLQEVNEKRATTIKPISSIIISNDDLEELEEQMKTLNEDSAKKAIKVFIKRGKTAEKASTYEITQKEFNKALIIAKEFNLKDQITKVSSLIFETEKKAKQVELDYAIEMGENAEKNSDNINAIYYYQKALKILEGFLIYDSSDSRMKKLKKKILNLREQI
jgi:hypothetical protein